MIFIMMNFVNDVNETERKVSINDVMPNMILSRNVITKKGFVLLSKGVMINANNFKKLLDHNVEYVYVMEHSVTRTYQKEKSDTLNNIKIKCDKLENFGIDIDNEEYKNFAKIYHFNNEEIKNLIHSISAGEAIDLEKLYALTDGIMDNLNYKSDILKHITIIKNYCRDTFSHMTNVALLCNLFSYWIDLDEAETINLTICGLLHDIGKVQIPKHILLKKGALTDEEFEIVKKHTVLGYSILKGQNIPEVIKLAALMHHEKIDGTGYPNGLKDCEIDKYAKIVTICDIYDAMTSKRVYREKICPFEVINMFETRAYGELDTEFLLIFLENIAYTYLGTWVNLSDGSYAEVVFINKNNLSRPVVRINDSEFIDLAKNKDLKIISIDEKF